MNVQPVDVVVWPVVCDAKNKTNGASKAWVISQHFVLTMPFLPIILWLLAQVDLTSSGAFGGTAPPCRGV
ncbi:hypothetical protein FG476_09255 [Xylella fastidiosa subsp. multiplex]|uniref:Uncharacterized protein n=1 Tax=Xylella fastidiosa subsp. multiplex TaxID=644357 RepID=A0A9Q4MIP0_XYLFS|nr:conserved hypothetical protein [Xylella fastidiosa M12]MRT34741.1 hypothetical protein [Xylella fastidiosa subsp. multiplex]TNV90176.1 hypothetical protein C5H23_04625 [Xylella fastidiosa]MRT46399.1 hypothetical protein [Xylella fastidiosa subsp. multiplex]MRT53589.1 hypothetical protein [Xylella fastidiosa subsp. multiplex]